MHLEATVCSQHRLQDIEVRMMRMQKEMQDVQASMRNIQKDEQRILSITTGIGDILEEEVINSMDHRSRRQPVLTYPTTEGLMAVKTNEDGTPDAYPGKRPSMLLESNSASLSSASGQSLPGVSIEKCKQVPLTTLIVTDKATLISHLGCLDSSDQDLQQCLDHGSLLSLVDQDRLKFMIRSSRLRAWLIGSSSRTVLINGNLPGNEVYSPMTVLTAQILEGLRVIRPVIELKFFCSMHIIERNSRRDDAVGMMKGFISQVLSMDRPWDLAFLAQSDFDGIQAQDFETLCKILYRLLRQLPEKAFAYCIIDGITFYERAERRQHFLKAINELLNIMDSCKNLVMKLLLTCHGRSQFVRRYVEDADVFLVPSDIDGEGQGWNTRESFKIKLPEH